MRPGAREGSDQGLDYPDIVSIEIEFSLHNRTETVDCVTVERQAGEEIPTNVNLDEDNVAPTMSNVDPRHDPRTGTWRRLGDCSQDPFGNIGCEKGHALHDY